MSQSHKVDLRREQILAGIAAREGDRFPLPAVLVVVAHPDDETLAIGARLARFTEARFLYVTDGAPEDGLDASAHGFSSLDAYRDARVRELHCALRAAGLSPEQLLTLGIPDQHAAFHLGEITRQLVALVAELSPDVILTHAYEGGHPDHDACAFAVSQAVQAAALSSAGSAPVIVEAPFYHAGPSGMETESFLAPQPLAACTSTRECPLRPDERERKRARLACFVSQQSVLAAFPLERELFRIAPAYDFTQPPHPGPALYDSYPWPIKSDCFRKLAAEALDSLNTDRLHPEQNVCP